MKPGLTIIVAVHAALLLAGCGSSSSSSSSRAAAPAPAPKPVQSSTTATPTTTTTVTTTPTTTTTAGVKRCVASALALSSLGQQGGMGHGELGFALRNTSSARCQTGGYPGVLFLDSAGRPLPTTSTRVIRDFFGTTPVVAIALAPGQSASFHLGTTHEAQARATCTTAAGLQVIPPNDTATLRTTIPNGGYECQAVTVSPLRPGLTGYP